MFYKSFIIALLFPLLSVASTIKVCKTCHQTTISSAIDLAQKGDTILIYKGTYKTHGLIIKKPLTIIGVDNPIIDGENKETIFTFKTDNFSVQNLTIINVGVSYTSDYSAILVYRSNHFLIINNTFKNVFFGLLIEKSHFGNIVNNIITSHAITESNSGNGIHLWHSSHMKIKGNKVSGLRDGIYFEFVKNSIISENISKNNVRYGLHFMFSNNNEYRNNTFENNGAGVAVMFSKHIKMYNNKFLYNWGTASYGLLLKEIYDAEIKNNTFQQNTIGLNIEGSTRINYTHNTFLRNGWAIKVRGACYQNIFKKNNFLYNAFDLSYNSNINSNLFENNFWSEYTGYDLDKNGIGDVPFRPVKLFSYIVNQTPETIVLLRSLFVDIINFSEKVSPVFTPDNLIDNTPLMKEIQ
ncbi:MAG: nitrous oxide reductase family maturation protein NosD [Flavobacteriaceae bacterium]|nr:nitrous oxide reductase family maturation protein NosD [Flavobacteriaceae bacterium]